MSKRNLRSNRPRCSRPVSLTRILARRLFPVASRNMPGCKTYACHMSQFVQDHLSLYIFFLNSNFPTLSIMNQSFLIT